MPDLSSYVPGLGKNVTIDGTADIAPASITAASLAANTLTNAQIATNTVGSAQLDVGTRQRITVALSSATILALFATPFQLIAAPGAGKSIIVEEVLVRFTAATQYASGGVVSFQYAGGAAAVTNTIAAAVINAATNSDTILFNTANITATQNAALQITNATGAFTTGTGTASVDIVYRVV